MKNDNDLDDVMRDADRMAKAGHISPKMHAKLKAKAGAMAPPSARGGAGKRPAPAPGVEPGASISGPLAGSPGTNRGNVVGGVDSDFDNDQDNEGTGTQRANTRTGGAYAKLSAPGGDKTAKVANKGPGHPLTSKSRPRGSDQVDVLHKPGMPSWGRS